MLLALLFAVSVDLSCFGFIPASAVAFFLLFLVTATRVTTGSGGSGGGGADGIIPALNEKILKINWRHHNFIGVGCQNVNN